MSDAIGAAATPLSRALHSPFFVEFFFKQEELDPHYGDVPPAGSHRLAVPTIPATEEHVPQREQCVFLLQRGTGINHSITLSVRCDPAWHRYQ